MVIHNFNVMRVLALPAEADAPLVIDADAVLSSAGAFSVEELAQADIDARLLVGAQ